MLQNIRYLDGATLYTNDKEDKPFVSPLEKRKRKIRPKEERKKLYFIKV